MDIMNSLMCCGEPYNSAMEAWDDDFFDPVEEAIYLLRKKAKQLPDKELAAKYAEAEDGNDMISSLVYGDEISRRKEPVDYTLPLMEDPSQPGYHRLPVQERQWDDELPF